MMLFFYLGVLSASMALTCIYPLFHDPDVFYGVFYSVISLVSFLIFSLTVKCEEKEGRIFNTITRTLYTALCAVAAEACALWLYVEVFSRWRSLEFMTKVFDIIFSLFRINHTMGDGNIYLYGMGDYVYTFSPNAGNCGMVYLMMFLAGLLTIVFSTRNLKYNAKYLLKQSILLVFYDVFRTTALIGLFCLQDVGEQTKWFYLMFFWHPVFSFLSFLPMAFIVWFVFSNFKPSFFNFREVFTFKNIKSHAVSAVLIGLCVSCIMLLMFWIPSGTEKHGKVLLDEYYSDWSKSTRPIDEEWYNSASTYNYYTLRTYLNSFYEVTVNEKPMESIDLSQYDVVVLKIPTKSYPNKFSDKIEEYVAKGGGLWIIGDHTNVFGSSTLLNPILKKFGIKLRHDAVYQNVHGSFNKFFAKMPMKHPIMQNVPYLLFATPCSIQVDNPSMRLVIPGNATKTYPLSYASKNFFPDTKPDLNIFFGTNTNLTAGEYHDGRIAVFSDSTIFSNFFIYLPGKAELALSIINWLNHKNSSVVIKVVLAVLAILFFALYCWRYAKIAKDSRFVVLPVAIAIVFIVSALATAQVLNKTGAALPEEKRHLDKIGFLDKYSSMYLPYDEWRENDENAYNTFYIWGQRVGSCNRYYFDIDEALQKSKAIFMVLPKTKFTTEDIAKIDSYMKKGGKVFLLDNGANESSANGFLSKYGLDITGMGAKENRIFESGKDLYINGKLPVGRIDGQAETILQVDDGKGGGASPVYVKKKVGDGWIYVFGDIVQFSDKQFGGDGVVPTGEGKKVNDLILRIYKTALE